MVLNSLQFDKFFYPSDFPMIIALRHNSQVHHLLKQQINHDKIREELFEALTSRRNKKEFEKIALSRAAAPAA